MYFLIVNIDNRQYKTFHIPQMFLIKAPGKNQAHGNLNKDLTGTLEKIFWSAAFWICHIFKRGIR